MVTFSARLCVHSDGFASRFKTSDLSETSRTSKGSRALKLRDGDEMADMDIMSVDPTSTGMLSLHYISSALYLRPMTGFLLPACDMRLIFPHFHDIYDTCYRMEQSRIIC
jgi:DNA gyrase/topoisomerase IV subunit A